MTDITERYEIEIEGTMRSLTVIQHFVEAMLKRLDIADPPAYDIRLAVDEMATNIVNMPTGRSQAASGSPAIASATNSTLS